MNLIKLRSMLERFYVEDIGDKDVTSENIFSIKQQGTLTFRAKQSGIFCGADIIKEGYRVLDPSVAVHLQVKDGDIIQAGDILAAAKGPVQSLLKGERVVLNLMQRMCGIATMTKKAVEKTKGTASRVCDTRKTMPGLRMLDKYSVRTGGGYNHRNGLYDGVMLKDNHISFSGSITRAVQKVREEIGHTVKVEVEIETKEQLLEAIEARADIIMFDNRTPEEIKSWIELVPNGIATEASGNITLENVQEYAKTGIEFISLGCLTHSVIAFDISARVQFEESAAGGEGYHGA
jgi:nicotinate-nucleotide pyrophosphorylase (carboxylating)